MKRLLFLSLFSLILGLSTQAQTLTKLWSTGDGLKTPESALFDEASNSIFVSNIDGGAMDKDENGFISILNADGKVKTLKWVTGLNAPKGQAISNGKYYVADIDELVEVDVKDGKVLQKYKVENAKFLNDVTASEDGTVFVSDMGDHKIYALKDKKLSLWLDDTQLTNVNGLWAEKGQLYIGTDKILQADLKTKSLKALVGDCGGIDGIEKMQDGNFVYSNWEGRIFITKGSSSVKLLDTVDKKMNTADIDWVPSKNIVLVPTFGANSVDAYVLKP